MNNEKPYRKKVRNEERQIYKETRYKKAGKRK
jgi:hypothetical protein